MILSCVVTNQVGDSLPGTLPIFIYHSGAIPDLIAPWGVLANSGGNTASVLQVDGCTYAWTIMGGTITDGPAASQMTFTAGGVPLQRGLHTATLLPNGQVILAGGFAGINYNLSQTSSNVECLNPLDGTIIQQSMESKRADHTATLLPNGKILMVGGYDVSLDTLTLNSSELFDPSTGQTSGPFGPVRYTHTATLLNNGQVLIVGGYGNDRDPYTHANIYLASAELFDPTTSTFTTVGSMAEARGNHQATLLSDGRVLITGGYHPKAGYTDWRLEYVGTAELFDPATKLFTLVGPMTMARVGHTATLLGDGRVLLAGGNNDKGNGDSIEATELFDPATGLFTPASPMGGGKSWATATLLPSGQVLITGGISFPTFGAEIYDPATGLFVPTIGPMTCPYRRGHTATLLTDGKVLVKGGSASFSYNVFESEIFDPSTGTFESPLNLQCVVTDASGNPSLPARANVFVIPPTVYQLLPVTVTAPDSVSAGQTNCTASVDPQDDATYYFWSVDGGTIVDGDGTPNLVFSAGAAGTLQLTCMVVAPDGTSESGTASVSVYSINPTLPLITAPDVVTAFVPGYIASTPDQVFSTYTWSITGGVITDGNGSSHVTFTPGPVGILSLSCIVQNSSGTASSPNGRVIPILPAGAPFIQAPPEVKDGSTGNLAAIVPSQPGSTFVWTLKGGAISSNPFADSIQFNAAAVGQARYGQCAILLENGSVLIAGGNDSSYQNTASAELFNPATALTSPGSPSMSLPRASYTATSLPGGKVLMAGGVQLGIGNGTAEPADLFDTASGTFTTTTNTMSTPRVNHVAVALNDHSVLLAGGTYISDWCTDCWPPPATMNSKTADMFDPVSSTFTPVVGVMTTERTEFTGSLLNDGRVLLAGGLDSSFTNIGTAETFDPATKLFSATMGPLNTPRADHTATTLLNGKVLITGGNSFYSATASAELFDPVAGTFVVTNGSMMSPRARHTATLLPNGKVLLTGGFDDSYGAIASAEVFDPGSATFSPVNGWMVDARAGHTATLLQDGTVLLAGGLGANGMLVQENEIFDPATGTFGGTLLLNCVVTDPASLNAVKLARRVAVLKGISVTINPSIWTMAAGETLQLTAQVTGDSSYSGLTWKLVSGNGQFDGYGGYTAPHQPETAVIQAISTADPTRIATATITVIGNPQPNIESFTASPGSVPLGGAVQLMAIFDNGTGLIVPGNLPITSGQPIAVVPTKSTLYQLVVTNAGSGLQAVQTKMVAVGIAPNTGLVKNWDGPSNPFGSGAKMSATRLQDGRICFSHDNSLSILDQNTLQFTQQPASLGPENSGIDNFTTELLPTGQVVFLGGAVVNSNNYMTYPTNSNVYDPVTGTAHEIYIPIGHMGRWGHRSLTAGDGSIIIGGGWEVDPTCTSGACAIFAANSLIKLSSNISTGTPILGSFLEPVGEMGGMLLSTKGGRVDDGVLLKLEDGSVLASGFQLARYSVPMNDGRFFCGSNGIFDTKTLKMQPFTQSLAVADDPIMTLSDGRILLGTDLPSGIYDPNKDAWFTLPSTADSGTFQSRAKIMLESGQILFAGEVPNPSYDPDYPWYMGNPATLNKMVVFDPQSPIQIHPAKATVLLGMSQSFRVTGPESAGGVTWTASGGVVDNQGNWYAPQKAGHYQLTAISNQDPTHTSTAIVEVPVPPIYPVYPTLLTLEPGQTFQFEGPVEGFTWGIQEAGGGTITQTGLYTAPGTPGTYTITMLRDPLLGGGPLAKVSVVTVVAPLSTTLAISPTSVRVGIGESITFTCASGGRPVQWGVTGGSISPTGTFTAPQTPGIYQVEAMTSDGSALPAIASVEVAPFAVTPLNAQVAPGQGLQFRAMGRPATLAWTATGGTISPTGLYTAPTATGIYTITADAGQVGIATAKVTVLAGLPFVNFTVGTQATVQPGTPIQLSWAVSNATTVTLVDLGDQPTSGSLTVSPQETTSYTLKATNEVGTTTVSRTVTVARHMVWQSDKIFGFGHLISEDTRTQTGTITTYVQSDQVGSPDWVTDVSGAMVGKSKNLPFGERFLWNGTLSSFRYGGHEDQAGSPIYMQARAYLPAYGKFASPDPAYDQDETGNLYTYCMNNPVTRTDPTGEEDAGASGLGVGGDGSANSTMTEWMGSDPANRLMGGDPNAMAALDLFATDLTRLGNGGTGLLTLITGKNYNVDLKSLSIKQLDAIYIDNYKLLAGEVGGGLLGVSVGSFYAGALASSQSGSVNARLPQDINVNPNAPTALPTNRPIGGSAAQNAEAQAEIRRLQQAGYTNIRVNQQQVNALGLRVGTNRPDVQATAPNGQRVYIEYDTSRSMRGPMHEIRIKANDPSGHVQLRKAD